MFKRIIIFTILMVLFMFVQVTIGGGSYISKVAKIKTKEQLQKVLTKNITADDLAAVKVKVKSVSLTTFDRTKEETMFTGKVTVTCQRKEDKVIYKEVYPFEGQIWNVDLLLDDIVTTLPDVFCKQYNHGCIKGNCRNGFGVRVTNTEYYSGVNEIQFGEFRNGIYQLQTGFTTSCLNDYCDKDDIEIRKSSGTSHDVLIAEKISKELRDRSLITSTDLKNARSNFNLNK